MIYLIYDLHLQILDHVIPQLDEPNEWLRKKCIGMLRSLVGIFIDISLPTWKSSHKIGPNSVDSDGKSPDISKNSRNFPLATSFLCFRFLSLIILPVRYNNNTHCIPVLTVVDALVHASCRAHSTTPTML